MASVSGASSVAAQKSAENRSKSCDTSVCTSNSSCFFKRRKPMNPLAYAVRPSYTKTNNNSVKQRVMSAKLIKVRQLQSQLNDANFHLAEVARENQVLKTLQKRQDKALSKYEDAKSELPKLLHSHEEELRVLSERNRSLKKNLKELSDQLKLKEEELNKTKEQLSRLEKLNKDKHLIERERLMESLEDLKLRLQRSEEQVNVLNRKLMLETKISKQRLNAETVRHKQSQRELLQALDEIDKLSGLLDAKENVARPRNPNFARLHHRDAISMVNLKSYHGPNRNFSQEKLFAVKESASHAPVTDVKLEPIRKDVENVGLASQIFNKTTCKETFKSPIDNIKQRLSNHENFDIVSDSRENSAGSIKSRPNSSLKLEKLPVAKEEFKSRKKVEKEKICGKKEEEDDGDKRNWSSEEKDRDDLEELDEDNQSKSEDVISIINREKVKINSTEKTDDSEKKLDRLTEVLDEAIQRASETTKEEFDKKLGNYCAEVLSSVKSCNRAIEVHKETLKASQRDTNNLLDEFKKTEKVESKLKKSFFNMDEDMDFVKEILNEEYKFQKESEHQNATLDKNSNIEKKPLVNLESKRKLLATLRAIDNGDSIDSLNEQKSGSIMKEIFGNVAR